MDVVAAVGADQEAAAVVQPGEGSFDDPAVAAEAGAVLGLGERDATPVYEQVVLAAATAPVDVS